MESEILKNLDNPNFLERLYRENKSSFKKDFNEIYESIKGNNVADVWNERLNYDNDKIAWGSQKEIIFVVISSIFAGIITKIPDIFPFISKETFFYKNISFAIFPFLIFYFTSLKQRGFKKYFVPLVLLIVPILYINILPENNIYTGTLSLVCIFMPILMYFILDLTFSDFDFFDYKKRIEFLKFSGDLVVISAIIFIAGAILTFISFALFKFIYPEFIEFYLKNIVVWGLVSIPIVGTYIVRTNPQIVNKVSPLIAKLFTPLVLITLFFYLISIVVIGKSPYQDREFLLVFNFLLIGVMALILFSTLENSKQRGSKSGVVLLILLSLLTIVCNGVALSAIVFRISEWGISPNRLTVFVSNILMLVNLVFIFVSLIRAYRNFDFMINVEKSIAYFFPVYLLWVLVVIFVFPLVFGVV
ncbi:MAG TPA: hypothetical protein PLG90_08570 [Ignavibacteria bacterium]|nr:hypothetical protein [Ignavibacteria bacterium]